MAEELLAGYGVFPPLRPNEAKVKGSSQADLYQLSEFIRRCGLNFKKHEELLASL
ncbi:hypothetical protein [Marinimicrobium sp. ARAG 43.8]|uniref:hypothetical protein n=1 Tax=Marinimicrobium sp. ARAG 43.8 TaxID=3418719 RepID=UPI003CFAF154